MKHAKTDERVSEMERLILEAWSGDRQLAQAALFAIGELKTLVDLRAAEEGLGIEAAWADIFDPTKLRAEIDGEDAIRRRAALCVKVELDHVRKLRAISRGDRDPLSAYEMRCWASRVAKSLGRLKPYIEPKSRVSPRVRAVSVAS
ncbi:MAG: hypothetical protein KF773_12250 [Deltaproteobacteria bacterium]|nr:hypothetical protein [Deltaproteobacteria bacterium]